MSVLSTTASFSTSSNFVSTPIPIPKLRRNIWNQTTNMGKLDILVAAGMNMKAQPLLD